MFLVKPSFGFDRYKLVSFLCSDTSNQKCHHNHTHKDTSCLCVFPSPHLRYSCALSGLALLCHMIPLLKPAEIHRLGFLPLQTLNKHTSHQIFEWTVWALFYCQGHFVPNWIEVIFVSGRFWVVRNVVCCLYGFRSRSFLKENLKTTQIGLFPGWLNKAGKKWPLDMILSLLIYVSTAEKEKPKVELKTESTNRNK